MEYVLEAASDTGGKNSLSQIGFLPIMYGWESDGVFMEKLLLGYASLGTDESQEPTSPDYNDALTI